MATEVFSPASATRVDILSELSVKYVEYDGAGVVYDDQFYLYNEYGEHLAERPFHSTLNRDVMDTLKWRFRHQGAVIYPSIEYRFDRALTEQEIAARKLRYPAGSPEANVKVKRVKLEPDLAVFIGRSFDANMNQASFTVGDGDDKELPPPDWVIEIGSPSTDYRDFDVKFKLYQDALKAKEYVVFDPSDEGDRLWRGPRLMAWQLESGVYKLLEMDEAGRYWSNVLKCWLVTEDRFLRFYDQNGNRWLTQLEYEQAEKERAQAETERERTAKEQAQGEIERVRAAKEAAERRIAELEAKLKALEAGGDKAD